MQSDKPKILIIDNSPGWTGAIKSILNSVRSMDVDYVFGIPKNSQLVPYFKSNGIKFIEISFLELRKHWSVIFYLPVLLYNSVRISKFCRKNKIQIIHVNDLYNMTGIDAKLFSHSLRLIYHVRLLPGSYISFFYKLWVKLVARFADEIITVSEVSRSNIQRFTKRDVTIIYDSVSAPEIKSIEKTGSKVFFLYPANYTVGKGQDFALRVFSEALKENKNIFLTFLGGDLGQAKNIAFKEKLKNDIQLFKLEEHVCLGNFEPNIFEAMSKHDVVLNFSESESFSMVCLEALLAGKVLIATDSGGPKELFENNKSGFLIDRNIESLKAIMLTVAEDRELRNKVGAEGRRHAMEKFNPTISTNRLQQIYLAQVTNTDS